MKTPYAILIGLALIAAAIFFRQPSIPPAQAGILGDGDGRTHCKIENLGLSAACVIIKGNKLVWLMRQDYKVRGGGNAWKVEERDFSYLND